LLVELYLQHFIYRLETKRVFGWARAISLFAQYNLIEENKNAKNKKQNYDCDNSYDNLNRSNDDPSISNAIC
jgi:hypothetical protein